ncbi:MAG: sulfatase-like hydrolase/transferase, partial [Silvibacterium sp.]|nr:sulfatase-like hydrolase/transferase [Silvibacterium sp.]
HPPAKESLCAGTGLVTFAGPKASRFRWYIFLTAFLVLPNLPLLVAARPISLLVRGYIDLDYLLIALLSLFAPRILTFLLLVIAVALDFMHAACITYFFAPAEFLNVIRFGGFLSTARIGLIAAAITGTLIVCAATTLCTNRRAAAGQRRIAFVIVLVTLTGLAFADIPNIRHVLFRRTNQRIPSRITRTPALGLIYSQYIYDRYTRGLRLGGQFAMPSATALALDHLSDYAPGPAQPNVVLVLVEAWGLPRDTTLRRAVDQPFSDPVLLARYNILRGSMPFEGHTTSGEGRELCGTHLGWFVTQGTAAQLERCVPAQMRRAGYRTLAVHGFNGDFFDRKDFYPKLGFDEILFHDRLQAGGLPDCPGPFTGTCDDAIAAWIGEGLRNRGDKPVFVHWVTLNSHLPILAPPLVKSPRPCGSSPITRDDFAVCGWYRLLSVALQSVHDLALWPLGRPTIFIVVGDHAPPFDKDIERDEFSATQVPYFILLPRIAAK